MVDTLVEAAICIANKGKGYDIDKQFTGWVKQHINNKLKQQS